MGAFWDWLTGRAARDAKAASEAAARWTAAQLADVEAERLAREAREAHFFHYELNSRTLRADPLAAWIKLQEHPTFDLEKNLEGIDAKDHRSWVAAAALARELFILPEFNPETGEGATMQQAVDVYARFIKFVNDAKKKIDTPLNLSRSAGLVFSGPKSPPSNDSASTSTPDESPTA